MATDIRESLLVNPSSTTPTYGSMVEEHQVNILVETGTGTGTRAHLHDPDSLITLGDLVCNYCDIPEKDRLDPGDDLHSHPSNGQQLMITHVGNFPFGGYDLETLRHEVTCFHKFLWTGPWGSPHWNDFPVEPQFRLRNTVKFKDPRGSGYFDVLWRELNDEYSRCNLMKYLPVSDVIIINVADQSFRDKIEVQDWIEQVLICNQQFLRGMIIVYKSDNAFGYFLRTVLSRLCVRSKGFCGKIFLCNDLADDDEFAKAVTTGIYVIMNRQTSPHETKSHDYPNYTSCYRNRNSILDIQYALDWKIKGPKGLPITSIPLFLESNPSGTGMMGSEEENVMQKVSLDKMVLVESIFELITLGFPYLLYAIWQSIVGEDVPITQRLGLSKLRKHDGKWELQCPSQSVETCSKFKLWRTHKLSLGKVSRPFMSTRYWLLTIKYAATQCTVFIIVFGLSFVLGFVPNLLIPALSKQIGLLYGIAVLMISMSRSLRTQRDYSKRFKESKLVWTCEPGNLQKVFGEVVAHTAPHSRIQNHGDVATAENLPMMKAFYTDIIAASIIRKNQIFKVNLPILSNLFERCSGKGYRWCASVSFAAAHSFVFVALIIFSHSNSMNSQKETLTVLALVYGSLIFPVTLLVLFSIVWAALERCISSLTSLKEIITDDIPAEEVTNVRYMITKIPLYLSSNVYRWWYIYEEVSDHFLYEFAEASGAIVVVLLAVLAVACYIITVWLLGEVLWKQAPVVIDGILLALIFVLMILRATKLSELKADILRLLDQWTNEVQRKKSEIESLMNSTVQEEAELKERQRIVNLLTDSDNALRRIRKQVACRQQEVIAFPGIRFSTGLMYFVLGTLIPAAGNALFLLRKQR